MEIRTASRPTPTAVPRDSSGTNVDFVLKCLDFVLNMFRYCIENTGWILQPRSALPLPNDQVDKNEEFCIKNEECCSSDAGMTWTPPVSFKHKREDSSIENQDSSLTNMGSLG